MEINGILREASFKGQRKGYLSTDRTLFKRRFLYDEYRHLTCSLIKSYNRIDDVSEIIYENGTVVTVDYNSKKYKITELK